MVTNLYFIRHAHSIYTPDELNRPLSERGLLDSKKATELLMKENIHEVISSPYKRAIQTVEGVARLLDKDVKIVEDLRERKLAEKSVEDFDTAIHKVWKDPTFSWDGGESNIVAQKRGAKATLNLLNEYEGKNVAIGSHGNIMVLIMNYFDPIYDFSFWKSLEMPDIYKLTFEKKTLVDVNQVWNF